MIGGTDTEPANREQSSYGIRQGPKAVAQLLLQAHQIRIVGGLGQLAVDPDAQTFLADVAVGDAGRCGGEIAHGGEVQEVERDIHIHQPRDRFPFKAGHGALEQLAIQPEADGGDVAALGCAEQVARAADLEVAQGQVEAGAE